MKTNTYKGVSVTPDTYIFEFKNEIGELDTYVSRETQPLERLLTFAVVNELSGVCIHPLTMFSFYIKKGKIESCKKP
jgi:hypothetical protein